MSRPGSSASFNRHRFGDEGADESEDDVVAERLHRLVTDLPATSEASDIFAVLLDSILFPASRLIRDDRDMEILSEEVLLHPRIEEDPDDVLRMLVRMVEGLELSPEGGGDVEKGYVLLSLVYHLGRVVLANTYRKVAELDGLLLLKPIVAGYGGCRIHRPAVKLLFEVCQVEELGLSDLGEIDEPLVVSLLDKMEVTDINEESEEELNALVRLMLAFNDQYVLKNHARTVIANPVISALSSRLHLGKKIGETVILIFNRADDASVQKLLIRFLRIIFTSPETADFFYTNDLQVILDVILRESRAVAEEDEELQQGYLSILPPLLKNAGQRSYKHKDVLNLLMELRRGSSSAPSSPTRSPVDLTFPASDGNAIGVRPSTRRVADQVFSECRSILIE
ncbi:hypothetical protein HDU67_009622 [Dinochytrium kinnereticum]|nr:hypothetical protein HDU67_009622 [Dinochytrium kinnereticum]